VGPGRGVRHRRGPDGVDPDPGGDHRHRRGPVGAHLVLAGDRLRPGGNPTPDPSTADATDRGGRRTVQTTMKHTLDAEFEALTQSMPAKVGVAIASVAAEAICFGGWSTGVAWSTIKVPLAIAALRADLASPDQLTAAITRSDNAAAEEMWSQLGDSAAQLVQSVIREAGDPVTVVESRRLRTEYTPFGQTRWPLADQARFAAGLSQVAGASSVVDLMQNLITDHRWGLAAKGFAAKGGWGPGLTGEYLVRQFAIVSETFGVALAAEVHDGGYEAGVEAIDSLADWIVDEALAEY
jgi:hypothetical protein